MQGDPKLVGRLHTHTHMKRNVHFKSAIRYFTCIYNVGCFFPLI